jgi:hypothetical protein
MEAENSTASNNFALAWFIKVMPPACTGTGSQHVHSAAFVF